MVDVGGMFSERGRWSWSVPLLCFWPSVSVVQANNSLKDKSLRKVSSLDYAGQIRTTIEVLTGTEESWSKRHRSPAVLACPHSLPLFNPSDGLQ